MNNCNRPYPHFKFPNEIVIVYKKLTEEECNWYNVPSNSYIITCSNYGWFPSKVLMGVVNGIFMDTNQIGASIRGKLGTASIAVINLSKALDLLKSEGYIIAS